MYKISNMKRKLKKYLFLQEKLETWLYGVRANIEKDVTKKQGNFNLNTGECF